MKLHRKRGSNSVKVHIESDRILKKKISILQIQIYLDEHRSIEFLLEFVSWPLITSMGFILDWSASTWVHQNSPWLSVNNATLVEIILPMWVIYPIAGKQPIFSFCFVLVCWHRETYQNIPWSKEHTRGGHPCQLGC